MLKRLHGGKATMLNGFAFTDKVDKLKKKLMTDERESLEKIVGKNSSR